VKQIKKINIPSRFGQMLLQGVHGAVHFNYLTGEHAMGTDVGYHSRVPVYEDHEPYKCNLVPEKQCYYDGSALESDRWYHLWQCSGDKVIWRLLEQEYEYRFGELR